MNGRSIPMKRLVLLTVILVGSSLGFAGEARQISPRSFDGDRLADLAVGVYGESQQYDYWTALGAGGVNVLYGSTTEGLSVVGDQFWNQYLAEIGLSETSDRFGYALAAGDFDGDGFMDLASGIPFEGFESTEPIIERAGAVAVLYGTSTGLSKSRAQVWDQGSAGILGARETEDFFGWVLAVGDFDGDGRDDLAIGVPGEDAGAVVNSGAVAVLYGTAAGLSATRNQLWDQDSAGVLGGVEPEDWFGRSLAAGDFNGDGWDDLAIGVPYENVGEVADAGAVAILYGSADGLTAAGNQLWDQNDEGIQNQSEVGDHFGAALATGDFNGDGRADLAIGVPGEATPVPELDAGAVTILYGAPGALSAAGNQLFDQDDLGEATETGDEFGSALASGDFNGDGKDDLAVGVPGEDVVLAPFLRIDAGQVDILLAGSSGLTATGSQIWTQDSPSILDEAEEGDRLGSALAAGNFDGDEYDDLAVGVPNEDLSTPDGAKIDAGAVNVFYGWYMGLASYGNQFWHQDVTGIEGTVDSYEHFGFALAAGPFRCTGPWCEAEDLGGGWRYLDWLGFFNVTSNP